MVRYYYDFSLPVKQTPHQVVTLGCQILICSWSYLIVKLKFFIAHSAKVCYLYKHRSNQIQDYMHRIKIKNLRGPFQLPAAILDSILIFFTFILVFKMTTAGFFKTTD